MNYEGKANANSAAATNIFVSEEEAAMRFVDEYGFGVRFDHDRRRWYIFNGNCWQPDGTRMAYSWMVDTATGMTFGAADNIKRSAGRASFADGVERIAQANQSIAVTSAIWNTDPRTLGTPGGVVDLVTGEMRRGKPEDYISQQTAVAPAATTDCPRWFQFLDEATGKDDELIRFLQRWSGYCLSGFANEQALAFVYGPSGTGKGTFANTIAAIMGDYARTSAMTVFMATKFDQHPEELAALFGARMITASETEEGRKWDSAKIKQMTGQDPIRCRYMRANSFEYLPTFKLTFLGNYAPDIENLDDAHRRRFNIVPFTHKPAIVDKNLHEQLKTEWPGILRWMIQGCLDWQRDGLQRPEAVKQATAEYFAEQDVFGTWLEERCDIDRGNDYKWEFTSDLMADWKAYAKAAGEDPKSGKAFGQRMRRHGLVTPDKPKRFAGRFGKYYAGIQLVKEQVNDGN